MTSPSGSTWRKWDLHVHTPDSLVQNYTGADPWSRFFDELRLLPPELSVIGINDYLFVSGYRKVLAEFARGSFPNLEAVFPVVEFRLANLVGTESEWQKVNFHVIFEELFDAATIEAQFLNGLTMRADLGVDGTSSRWSGTLSLENLRSFGAAIRSEVPEERQAEYPESDLMIGFNNFTIDLRDIQTSLDHTALAGRSLLAVGKSEWDRMRWNAQSIALKKSLLNAAALIFTASESPGRYKAALDQLKTQNVNHHLLDCSDAHHWIDSTDKDRLGNCSTWICAQPTLQGLRHALTEFDHRVFVGPIPPKISSVRTRPYDFMTRVRLRPSGAPADDGLTYFNAEVPLNPGFVAVVGNKGKGKSALLDSIALAGNCKTEANFTFLSRERFRNPAENRAPGYLVEVSWADGRDLSKRLDEHTDPIDPQFVTYLPQRLLDEICSVDPGEPSKQFARYLGEVLFAHVQIADRLEQTSLEDLIAVRTRALDSQLATLRAELSLLNQRLIESERSALPAAKERVTRSLSQARAHERALLEREVPTPTMPVGVEDDAARRIAELQGQREDVERGIQGFVDEDAELALAIEHGNQVLVELGILQRTWDAFRSNTAGYFEELGLPDPSVVALVSISSSPVEDAIALLHDRRAAIAQSLDPSNAESLRGQSNRIQGEIQIEDDRLNEPMRLYREARVLRDNWERELEDIRQGGEHVVGIVELEEQLAEFERVPVRLAELRTERTDLTRQIYAVLNGQISIYETLYAPARSFIDHHELAERVGIAVGAVLIEEGLSPRLFDVVSRRAAGTFRGSAEGTVELDTRISATSFADFDSVEAFVTELEGSLHEDRRATPPVAVDIEATLRSGHSLLELYDLIFGLSYLHPQFSLRFGDADIDRLSPGEKGTILLMFYLLVDPSTSPILLDQPDENLDNQTIKDLLVPAIKEASLRRQVIVVTHNPNVAVVADADQLVVADRAGVAFNYVTGAIEDLDINTEVVDILEGTWPAFRNRSDKYIRPATSATRS